MVNGTSVVMKRGSHVDAVTMRKVDNALHVYGTRVALYEVYLACEELECCYSVLLRSSRHPQHTQHTRRRQDDDAPHDVHDVLDARLPDALFATARGHLQAATAELGKRIATCLDGATSVVIADYGDGIDVVLSPEGLRVGGGGKFTSVADAMNVAHALHIAVGAAVF